MTDKLLRRTVINALFKSIGRSDCTVNVVLTMCFYLTAIGKCNADRYLFILNIYINMYLFRAVFYIGLYVGLIPTPFVHSVVFEVRNLSLSFCFFLI